METQQNSRGEEQQSKISVLEWNTQNTGSGNGVCKPAKTVYITQNLEYIQFNGKDSSDDKSVKIGYPWHRKPGWRQALQSQKAQNLSRYVLYAKTFLFCIHDSRTCSGGVLVFPYQIENSRPVLRQYRFAGRSAFPIPQGGCILQKKLPFPRCRMDGIFIYSGIER